MAPKGIVIAPSPDSVGQRQKAVELGKSTTEASIAAATAPAKIREARANANIAEMNEQEKRQQLQIQNGVPTPGDTTKTGPEYLATLAPSMRNQVQAMLDGRIPYPTGAALRSPQMQTVIAAATQADPTYDAANSKTRVATRKDFTSGKSAQNITALNTVIGHLGSLYQSAQDLHNNGFKPYNTVANALENATTGFPALKSFNLSRQAVADEMERVFRQAGGNVSEIQGWRQSFDSSSTPDEFRASVAKAMELLNSRLDALSGQYQQGMGKSVDGITFLKPHAQAIFQHLAEGGDGILPTAGPTAPPKIGGGGNNPPAPPGGGTVPHADYSAMVGGPQQNLATGQTRQAYDPVVAGALSAMIRKGVPVDQANTYLASQGATPIDPSTYAQAVAFAKAHGGATNVEADKTLPVSVGERLASSGPAAGVVGFGAGATAGLTDTAGRSLLGPEWDANRAALAATHPGWDIGGNLLGGAVGTLGGEALLGKAAPGALGVVSSKLGRFAPIGGDLGYGALYGANEDPDNPLRGAFLGGLTGAAAGGVGRAGTRGLANVIAPPVGDFGPLYESGIFPTPGQRFGKSGIPGRVLNVTEQALQSVPVLGAAPATARQATRDAFQTGAFNNSLSELAPFEPYGVQSSLPSGTGPGTTAHAFTTGEFNKAYDIARSGMQFVPDPQYMADASTLAGSPSVSLLNADQRSTLKNFIDNSVVSRLKANGGVLNGDQYKAAASEIGNAIDKWSRTDPLLADAMSDYASVFDNAARRNSDPSAVNLLDAADRGYAQFTRIQRASELGGAAKEAGTFTPTNYAASVKQGGGGVRSSAYNQGNALGQDYATAGLNLSDKLADSGTPIRLGVLGALQGVEGAGLAATHSLGALTHPGSLAAFAPYAPVAREITNRLIAPRQFVLPPELADPLNIAGAKINQMAPFVGKAAVPGALAYYGLSQ